MTKKSTTRPKRHRSPASGLSPAPGASPLPGVQGGRGRGHRARYGQGRRATAEAGLALGQLWIEGRKNFLDKAGGETVEDFAPRVFGTSYSWLARCEKLWRDRHKLDEADRWMEAEGRALGWTVPPGTGGVDYARRVIAAYHRHLDGQAPPPPKRRGGGAEPEHEEREDIRAAAGEEFEAARDVLADEVALLRRENDRLRARAARVVRALREKNARLRAENERLRSEVARAAPPPPPLPDPVRPPPPSPAGADRPFASATAPEGEARFTAVLAWVSRRRPGGAS